MFGPLVVLFFLRGVFDSVYLPSIEIYGGSYVPFALVGLVVTTYSFTALRAFSDNLRSAQITGTLEVLLLTRSRLSTIIVGWALFPFLEATIQMIVFLACGFLVLGVHLGDSNVAGTLLVLILTVAIMAGFGILAAGFTLIFKKGDPFTGLIVAASGLLSGTMYPVSVLPEWLQTVAHLLPQTYSIEATRLAILQGASVVQLLPQLGPLILFAGILLPLSLAAFHYSMRRALVEGSLAHY